MSGRFSRDGEGLQSLDAALDSLAERLGPATGVEEVPLATALGRVAAADVLAGRFVPPHANSAMDGYAVFFDDLAASSETRLPLGGRIAAGHPLGRAGKKGEALRIFTGAPMPEGPDTVVMQEQVRLEGEAVILPQGVKKGANVRPMGEDIASGDLIIAAGRRLRPQDLAIAASVGIASLPVRRKLKAAVFSTGDEVRDPSGDAPPGCIFDANRFAVMALLEGLGVDVTDLGILPDREDRIAAALTEAAASHHLIVTSGGVSEGEEDHVRPAVQSKGNLHFWKLAIKPGKPVALGEVGNAVFVGLPGNPVSAMVTFMLIGRAVVLLLMGRKDIRPLRILLPAAFSLKRRGGRREWLRGSMVVGHDGLPALEKFRTEGSGVLSSMVACDGLIEVPEDVERVEPGDLLGYIPFNEVIG